MGYHTLTQRTLGVSDLFFGFIDAMREEPGLFLIFLATAGIILFCCIRGFKENRSPDRNALDDREPIPYQPRSFSTPAPKGFQRDHQGTVVDMQSRKRGGNEAA